MRHLREMHSKISEKISGLLKKEPEKLKRVVIELTNLCNLNCPYCLVGMQNEQKSVAHSALNREFGKIDMRLCEKIISDAKDFGISEAMLTFQGEPLLHERFAEVVEMTKKAGMLAVVFTNGMLLDADKARRIIRAGLDSVRFSVDGASEETYQVNRVGGRFSQVFANMRDMSRIAREEKSSVKIIWQFIALRNNEKEIPLARKMAGDIGVEFLVKPFAESIPALAASGTKYKREIKRKPCTDIYEMLCVCWNGDVVPCCYDVSAREIMGNIRDNTLREIWESAKYADFRARVKRARINPAAEPLLCKGCLRWSA